MKDPEPPTAQDLYDQICWTAAELRLEQQKIEDGGPLDVKRIHNLLDELDTAIAAFSATIHVPHVG